MAIVITRGKVDKYIKGQTVHSYDIETEERLITLGVAERLPKECKPFNNLDELQEILKKMRSKEELKAYGESIGVNFDNTDMLLKDMKLYIENYAEENILHKNDEELENEVKE